MNNQIYKKYNSFVGIRIKNKYNLDNFLLGDYLLCHHNNFQLPNTIQTLKYCRGLKYFLPGLILNINSKLLLSKKFA